MKLREKTRENTENKQTFDLTVRVLGLTGNIEIEGKTCQKAVISVICCV